MKLEALKYLHDIQHAVNLLNEFTSGKSYADYEADSMLQSAVERQFEVIGEAMLDALVGSVDVEPSDDLDAVIYGTDS